MVLSGLVTLGSLAEGTQDRRRPVGSHHLEKERLAWNSIHGRLRPLSIQPCHGLRQQGPQTYMGGEDSLLLPSRCSQAPLASKRDSFYTHYSDGTARVTGSVEGIRMGPGHLRPPYQPVPPALRVGFQPPVNSFTFEPRGSPYISTAAWGHKGDTAARNPSICHVRSKLRFSPRA